MLSIYDVGPEDSSRTSNWLALHAATYCGSTHTMTGEERTAELRGLVDRAVDNILALVHDGSGTSRDQ